MDLSNYSNSCSDEEIIFLIGLVISLPNNCKRKHKKWVRDIFNRRNGGGSFNLVRETAFADKEMFFRYMRMTPLSFEHLLSLVAAKVTKQTTNYREPYLFGRRLLDSPMLDLFFFKHFFGLILFAARQRFIIQAGKFSHFERKFFITLYGSHFFAALLSKIAFQKIQPVLWASYHFSSYVMSYY